MNNANVIHKPPFLEPAGESWWRSIGVSLAIALVSVLVYANSFQGAFIGDDLIIVVSNPLVKAPDLAAIFRTEYWHGLENNGLYRPMTILSLAMNRYLFGSSYWGFHLVNVLLHSGAAVLLRLVLRRWGFSAISAGLAAFLFAVHPIHTEVVNQVVGRSELLVAFLLLLGFWWAAKDGWLPSLLVCICFLLALLSKEHAITFLALLPIADAFREGAYGILRRRIVLYAALLLLAGFWLLWRKTGLIVTLPPSVLSPVAVPLAYVPWLTRVLTAVALQWFYVGKLILPLRLQMFYATSDLPPFVTSIMSVPGLLVIGSAISVALLLGRGWRQRSPFALFGVLFIISFLPTSNLLFPIGVTFAERLAYLPSLWFCAGIGTGVAYLLHTGRLATAAMIIFCGYVSILGALSLIRNRDFSSSLRLFSAEAETNPQDAVAWLNVAEGMNAAGNYSGAEAAYQRVFSLEPDFSGALRSRTLFLIRQNRLDEALANAKKTLRLAQVQHDECGIAADLLDVGSIYLQLGQYETALSWLDRSAKHYGPLEAARYEGWRGMTLAALNRYREAAEAFARIPEERLVGSDIPYEFALVLVKNGRVAEARFQLERAIRVNPTAPAWNLLGVVLMKLEQKDAAAKAFEQAVKMDPRNAHYQENLNKLRSGQGGT